MRDRMWNIGDVATTRGGQKVLIVAISNVDTSYETVVCYKGIHRYNRRDYGRTTGTQIAESDLMVGR